MPRRAAKPTAKMATEGKRWCKSSEDGLFLKQLMYEGKVDKTIKASEVQDMYLQFGEYPAPAFRAAFNRTAKAVGLFLRN